MDEKDLESMKKILLSLLMLSFSMAVYAIGDEQLATENKIQARINNVGTQILNSNQFSFQHYLISQLIW